MDAATLNVEFKAQLEERNPWLTVLRNDLLCVTHEDKTYEPNAFKVHVHKEQSRYYPPAKYVTEDSLESVTARVQASIDSMLAAIDVNAKEELQNWFFYLVFDHVRRSLTDDGVFVSVSFALVAVSSAHAAPEEEQVWPTNNDAFAFDSATDTMVPIGEQAEEISDTELEQRILQQSKDAIDACVAELKKTCEVIAGISIQQGIDIDATLDNVRNHLRFLVGSYNDIASIVGRPRMSIPQERSQ